MSCASTCLGANLKAVETNSMNNEDVSHAYSKYSSVYHCSDFTLKQKIPFVRHLRRLRYSPFGTDRSIRSC